MTGRADRFTFEGSGGDRLAARLDLPAGETIAVALFVHCFTCSKDVLAASRIAKALLEDGIAVLRFDFTGLGSSGGEFANTTFSSNIDDVVAAAAALRSKSYSPQILIGHSLGGAAVLAAAARIPEAAAVVTINAPFDPAHVTQLLSPQAVAELEHCDEVSVQIAGRSFRLRRQFLVDIKGQNLREAIRTLGKALLILHSPSDATVEIASARQIFDAARHSKSFVSLDHADHLLSDPADSAYVARVVVGWVSRYLPVRRDGPVQEGEGNAEDGRIVVRESGRGRLEQEIRAGRHTLIADEPMGLGDDHGPTPYDLLLAALGACTSMTLRMYAERKRWPLEGISVRLRHDPIHADDCRDCEATSGAVDHIERVLELNGDLSIEQRHRLLEIAEKCPVHRTLIGEKQIVTNLALGAEVEQP